MKKILFTATALLLVAASGSAQTIYDAVKFADKDLNGTARFVGMGGAMGALGGDISTIGTNPAGIGIYRSNDFMASFGFSAYGTEANYEGYKKNNDNTRWSFDNVGAVLSTKIGNYTSLRYVNFGFNYKRSKSLYNNTSMEGLLNLTPDNEMVSQTYQMTEQAMGVTSTDLKGAQAFSDPRIGWLSALGYQGWLIDPGQNNIYTSVLNSGGEQPYANFRSQEKGGVDQYDFNVAFNFSDRVYLGVTLGAYDVNYNKYSSYDEDFGGKTGYSLETWNNITGAGFDFKMGAIIRPFEYSPLRIGVAVHSPIFYKLTSDSEAYLVTDLLEDGEIKREEISTYDELGNRFYSTEYRLRTPWKYNLSLGYTVGKDLAIGAEYEYQDYSTMKFNDEDGYDMWESQTAKAYLKGVSAFRIGAEYKVIPQFAFRLGYNYTTTAFKDIAYKQLPKNSVLTDTDYTNANAKSDYTLGIGYRGNVFYTDLAYKFTTYKGSFYAFADPDDYLKATEVTNTRSQVLFTVGMRF